MLPNMEIVPFVAGNFVLLHILDNFGITIAVQTSGTGIVLSIPVVIFVVVVVRVRFRNPVVIGHAIILGDVAGWYIVLGQSTKMGPSRFAQVLKVNKVIGGRCVLHVIGGGGGGGC